MDSVKSVLLGVCLLAIATGILKMLIPENRFKTQISFLISCIFAISLLSGFDDMTFFTSFDFKDLQTSEIIDFSDKLSEEARKEAAKAVRLKTEQLLSDNDYKYEKVYVIAHINGAFCISISEIEIVFSTAESEKNVHDATELVSREVGSDILVRYSFIKKEG